MWIAAVWTSLRLTSHGVCGVVADWRHLCCLESLPWGCSSSLVNYRKWAKKKRSILFFFLVVWFPPQVVPDFLQPHGLEHARLQCPSLSPRVCSNSVHWVSDAMQPFHPLSSLLLLPSVFPSIWVFSSESVLCIRWPKCWRFSFSISPSSEYSGLISFTI